MSSDPRIITLTSITGLSVMLSNYGARIVSIQIPLNSGYFEVHECYADHNIYVNTRKYSGATVGPIANRVKDAAITIGSESYNLQANEGSNCLHSGNNGLHQKTWKIDQMDSNSVVFKTTINDLEDGLPGNRTFICRYSLVEDDIIIDWQVSTDRSTHINITNHAYFNLGSPPKLDEHFFMLSASGYLEVDEEKIPSGKILDPVEKFNLDTFQRLDGRIFDHTFVIKDPSIDHLAGAAYCPETDITLEVYTDQPGLHFYSGNPRYFAFETQFFPNSANQANFPSTLTQPEKPYIHQCIYRFNY